MIHPQGTQNNTCTQVLHLLAIKLLTAVQSCNCYCNTMSQSFFKCFVTCICIYISNICGIYKVFHLYSTFILHSLFKTLPSNVHLHMYHAQWWFFSLRYFLIFFYIDSATSKIVFSCIEVTAGRSWRG